MGCGCGGSCGGSCGSNGSSSSGMGCGCGSGCCQTALEERVYKDFKVYSYSGGRYAASHSNVGDPCICTTPSGPTTPRSAVPTSNPGGPTTTRRSGPTAGAPGGPGTPSSWGPTHEFRRRGPTTPRKHKKGGFKCVETKRTCKKDGARWTERKCVWDDNYTKGWLNKSSCESSCKSTPKVYCPTTPDDDFFMGAGRMPAPPPAPTARLPVSSGSMGFAPEGSPTGVIGPDGKCDCGKTCTASLFCGSIPITGRCHCWWEITNCSGEKSRWEVWQSDVPRSGRRGSAKIGKHLQKNYIADGWFQGKKEDEAEHVFVGKCEDGEQDPCDISEMSANYPWKDVYPALFVTISHRAPIGIGGNNFLQLLQTPRRAPITEPTGFSDPNSNSFAEYVNREMGFGASAPSCATGLAGWGWHSDRASYLKWANRR